MQLILCECEFLCIIIVYHPSPTSVLVQILKLTKPHFADLETSMSLQSDLQSQGWNLSQEGIDLLCEGLTNPSAKDVIKKVTKHYTIDVLKNQ